MRLRECQIKCFPICGHIHFKTPSISIILNLACRTNVSGKQTLWQTEFLSFFVYFLLLNSGISAFDLYSKIYWGKMKQLLWNWIWKCKLSFICFFYTCCCYYDLMLLLSSHVPHAAILTHSQEILISVWLLNNKQRLYLNADAIEWQWRVLKKQLILKLNLRLQTAATGSDIRSLKLNQNPVWRHLLLHAWNNMWLTSFSFLSSIFTF